MPRSHRRAVKAAQIADFDDWMKAVNRKVDELTGSLGLTSDDFPDAPFRDWYNDEVSITTAAKRCIKEEW